MKEELKEHWHTIENHYRLEERLVELEAINKEHQRINGELQTRISDAIDKLYCWGDVIRPDIQLDLLETLNGKKQITVYNNWEKLKEILEDPETSDYIDDVIDLSFRKVMLDIMFKLERGE